MTGPIEQQRRQAAALGPSAALRQQNTGQREMLISRRPGRAHASEWQELQRRRRELEQLAALGG